MKRTNRTGQAAAIACGLALATLALPAQGRLETARVTTAAEERTVALPGELQAFESVALVARVQGYVDSVAVDRGSDVRRGQVLATLVAPELAAQVAEAEARVEAAVARRAEADADLASSRMTFERLSAANETAGAVAGLELRHAEEALKAATARVESAAKAADAARASRDAVKTLEGYLRVTAPFAGRITERMAHPGALVGPSAGPLLRLEHVARLRLTVAVPEQYAGVVTRGRRLDFRVPAHGARVFNGAVARAAGSLDQRTRTMAVELDVENGDLALAPGMFPEVIWPVTPQSGAVLVPATSVVSTTERTFVVRVQGGQAEWVTVKRVAVRGDKAEVVGALSVGDTVLVRGSDEIRAGTRVP